MRILLIDDERSLRAVPAEAEVVVARTSAAALKVLEKDIEGWDEVWFDHDLALLPDGTKDTTIPVLNEIAYRWFSENPVRIQKIYIHTGNNVGKATLVNSLRRYGYQVIEGVDLKKAFIITEELEVLSRGWVNRV